jgi:hypothetical protein
MRIIDAYALLTGSKINKPYIFDSYFPIENEKYITIQSNTQFDSRNYSYWQDVVDFIIKKLEKKQISIIQVGVEGDPPLMNIPSTIGKTNINQLAYIIKNSICHIGPDSLCTHLASYYDKPIVGLFSANHAEISKPIFGSPEKLKIIDSYSRVGNKKPSFSPVEDPKSINLIKPEEIIQKIAEIIPDLDLEQEAKIESLFFGKTYPKIMLEFVPDKPILIDRGMSIPLNIRFDYLKSDKISDENLHSALVNFSSRKCCIITSMPFDLHRSRVYEFKQNISSFIFHIERKHLSNIDESIKFIEEAKKNGINPVIALIKKHFSDEEINELKFKFLDIGKINLLDKTSWEECIGEDVSKKINDLTIFKSSRIIFSNGKNFLSKTAYLEDSSVTSFEQRLSSIKDKKSLGEELESCYIYNQ